MSTMKFTYIFTFFLLIIILSSSFGCLNNMSKAKPLYSNDCPKDLIALNKAKEYNGSILAKNEILCLNSITFQLYIDVILKERNLKQGILIQIHKNAAKCIDTQNVLKNTDINRVYIKELLKSTRKYFFDKKKIFNNIYKGRCIKVNLFNDIEFESAANDVLDIYIIVENTNDSDGDVVIGVNYKVQ